MCDLVPYPVQILGRRDGRIYLSERSEHHESGQFHTGARLEAQSEVLVLPFPALRFQPGSQQPLTYPLVAVQ